MKQTQIWQHMLPMITVVALILLWEAAVRIKDMPLYILPAPTDILQALAEDWRVLLSHSIVTLSEAVFGIAIAVLLGIVFGIVLDGWLLLKRCIYPILVVTQTVPAIVLAPLFVIYMGFGPMPKIITVVLMCFFPIVVNFSDGMTSVDEGYIHLVRSFGAKKWQVYTLVKLPAALPSFISGLRVAVTYSISGAIVGEWIGAGSGLGYYMLRAKNAYMLDKVFACVVIIVLLSLLMNGIVRLLQNRSIHSAKERTSELCIK